jgi:hypothetical protein
MVERLILSAAAISMVVAEGSVTIDRGKAVWPREQIRVDRSKDDADDFGWIWCLEKEPRILDYVDVSSVLTSAD